MSTHLVSKAVGDSVDWGHMNGWGGGRMWLWGAVILLSWIAIIAVAVVWAGSRSRSAESGKSTSARQILEERYARGELSTEEYHERMKHLS